MAVLALNQACCISLYKVFLVFSNSSSALRMANLADLTELLVSNRLNRGTLRLRWSDVLAFFDN